LEESEGETTMDNGKNIPFPFLPFFPDSLQQKCFIPVSYS
jgi:hypothetical protein